MNRWLTLSGAVLTIALSTSLASGQQPKADCKAKAPETVQGQVVRVDPNTNKITIRDTNGATHEFQANQETTKDMKVGDQVEAKLREAPKC
jgi:Cu/Ag efflux protein CusF